MGCLLSPWFFAWLTFNRGMQSIPSTPKVNMGGWVMNYSSGLSSLEECKLNWRAHVEVAAGRFSAALIVVDHDFERLFFGDLPDTPPWHRSRSVIPIGALSRSNPPSFARPGTLISEVYFGWPIPYVGNASALVPAVNTQSQINDEAVSWERSHVQLLGQWQKDWNPRFINILPSSSLDRVLWRSALLSFASWNLFAIVFTFICGRLLRLIQRRRITTARCVLCGYSRSNTPSTALCPECGSTNPAFTIQPSSTAPASTARPQEPMP